MVGPIGVMLLLSVNAPVAVPKPVTYTKYWVPAVVFAVTLLCRPEPQPVASSFPAIQVSAVHGP